MNALHSAADFSVLGSRETVYPVSATEGAEDKEGAYSGGGIAEIMDMIFFAEKLSEL